MIISKISGKRDPTSWKFTSKITMVIPGVPSIGVRPEPTTMEIPTVSPFGRRRVILPIDKLVKSNRRLYFADFWCHNEIHYVTLVVTKPNTDAYIYCREHLPKLSLESNPFLYQDTFDPFLQDGTKKPEFYCCEEPRVEIFTQRMLISIRAILSGTESES